MMFRHTVYLLDRHLNGNSALLPQALQRNQFALAGEAHEKAAVYALMSKKRPQMVCRQANTPAVTAMHQYAVGISTIPGQVALSRDRYIHYQLLLGGQSEILLRCSVADAQLTTFLDTCARSSSSRIATATIG